MGTGDINFTSYMKTLLNKIANIGVKPHYLPWEIHLTRKINLSSLLGFANVVVGVIVFVSLGYMNAWKEILSTLLLVPFIYIANAYLGYIAASYIFAFMGYLIFFILSARTGMESLSFLYYFPFIIGLTQMLWRKEMMWHLLIQLSLCLASILFLLYGFESNLFKPEGNLESLTKIKFFNIGFSFFAAIAFIVIIAFESVQQEYQLEAIAKQKEILLAELYHRVKNNLNLVTSLLNLKKNTIGSIEGQKALEEIRNLVYSMSMIHDKVYSSENKNEIQLDEYINELAADLIKNLSGSDTIALNTNSQPVILNITQAIPCGLIINELITNSFKHAKREGIKLEISIALINKNNTVELIYSDNGPGIKKDEETKNTLGLVLINSLSDQLDATAQFKSENGFHFTMTFKPV